MRYPKIKKCRGCTSQNLVSILDLGSIAVSDFMDSPSASELRASLALVLCEDCHLLQLAHVGVSPDLLYRKYWYKSGINTSMREALKDLALYAQQLVKLKKGDVVVDIGANDGTLLSYLPKDVIRVAFEPAMTVQGELQLHASVIVPDYFSKENYRNKASKKRAACIISAAMFYDLIDPLSFLLDLKSCLLSDGLWINQMSSLADMLTKNDYPNICHEHLTYYSLTAFQKLLGKAGLRLLDFSHNEVNGGSIRTVAVFSDSKRQPTPEAKARLQSYLAKEKEQKLGETSTLLLFASRVSRLRLELSSLLQRLHREGKTIYVYGASTKGNTLLQYCGLRFPQIRGAFERNASKWGKYTVATQIPIYPEAMMKVLRPDYLLVLPWHFKAEFVKRERQYLQAGGKMIFPLPHLEIV